MQKQKFKSPTDSNSYKSLGPLIACHNFITFMVRKISHKCPPALLHSVTIPYFYLSKFINIDCWNSNKLFQPASFPTLFDQDTKNCLFSDTRRVDFQKINFVYNFSPANTIYKVIPLSVIGGSVLSDMWQCNFVTLVCIQGD